MKSYLLLVLALVNCSCMMRTDEQRLDAPMREQYRPQFHFSPAAHWTNDPNGMFYLDNEYHLFYQHNPAASVWGPMYWGHAVSNDLIHWKHLPIALSPDSLGYIFSGSAVVDKNNTSGLGTSSTPPIILIFTYHNMDRERAGQQDYQSQGLAYSVDKGRTWKKYKLNPIISNPGSLRDFRDPKVFRDEPRDQWVMTLAVKDHVEFFVSSNLTEWKKTGEFGHNAGAHGGVWECPDLIRMVTDQGDEKFVLLVSMNPGAPNGGSGTQYFVGQFDGKTFLNDDGDNNRGWLDYGTDNYAAVTFSNVPQDKVIALGWMSNWNYAQTVPTTVWRNAMTIPRELRLVNSSGKLVLASVPIAALQSVRAEGVKTNHAFAGDAITSETVDLPSSEIELILEVDRTSANNSFAVSFLNNREEELIVGVDASNRLYIDRTRSGETAFGKGFGAIHYAPRFSGDRIVKLKILLDASSVEMFADEGLSVMTDLVFPRKPYNQMKITAVNKGVKINDLKIYPVKSIWQEKK